MAKINIKSEKITPFWGIFQVREQFSRYVGPFIDEVLGVRCASFGYQYSEIVSSLSRVYFFGGDCVEDVTSHLVPHLSLHPTLRTCSSDTILRCISELATANTTSMSSAPAWIAVPARERLWRPSRGTPRTSISVPTAAHRSMTACLPYGDGSARPSTTSSMS